MTMSSEALGPPEEALRCPWCSDGFLYRAAVPSHHSATLVQCSNGGQCAGIDTIRKDHSFLASGIPYEEVLQKCFAAFEQHLLSDCPRREQRKGKRMKTEDDDNNHRKENREDEDGAAHSIVAEASLLMLPTEVVSGSDDRDLGKDNITFYFLYCDATDERTFVL